MLPGFAFRLFWFWFWFFVLFCCFVVVVFLTLFRLYRNVLCKGSGLLLFVFHFGLSNFLKIGSMRIGRSCHECALHRAVSVQVRGCPVCTHTFVDVEMGYSCSPLQPQP